MPRERTDSRASKVDVASVTAIYGLCAVLLTWPLVLGIARVVPSDLGDPVFNAWVLAWVDTHLLEALSGKLSALTEFWHANIFYPHPYTLAYSDHQTAQALQALPVFAITRNPILAYNTVFLLTYVLSGVGTFLLVRELTGNRGAAFVAGLAYAFAPFRAGALSHSQVLSSQWMPFALYGFACFFRTGRRTALAGGVAAWVLQNLSSGYYLLFFSPLLALFAAWNLTRLGLWRDARTVGSVALALAVGTAITLPFLLPYQALRALGFEARPRWEVETFSADLLAFVTAPSPLRLWGPVLQVWPRAEGALFPGLCVTALAGIGSVAAWRRVNIPERATDPRYVRGCAWLAAATGVATVALFFGWSLDTSIWSIPIQITRIGRTTIFCLLLAAVVYARSPSARRRIAARLRPAEAVFVAMLLITAILALGPSVHWRGETLSTGTPYGWLYAYVPGWDGLRVPARFGMLVALFLAVLSGYGMAVLSKKSGIVTVAVSLLILAESAAFPVPVNGELSGYRIPDLPPHVRDLNVIAPIYQRIATIDPNAVLLELPLGEPVFDIRAMYASTRHRRRLVNGYSGGFPADYQFLKMALADIPERLDVAGEAVKRSGATHILLHAAEYGGRVDGIVEWFKALGAHEIAAEENDRLFALPEPPAR